jgi:hypothetical protein
MSNQVKFNGLILVLFAMIACAPQGNQESESKKEVSGAIDGDARPPVEDKVHCSTSGNFSAPNCTGSNLPPKIKEEVIKLVAYSLRPKDAASMALVSSNAGIIEKFPLDQQKKFAVQNQGIVDCTLGQYQVIGSNEMSKCEQARICGLSLSDIERSNFDIYKILSSSYSVLQEAAASNELKYCAVRLNPMGFP